MSDDGRKQNGDRGRGRNRRDAPENYWHKKRPPLYYGDYDFRVRADRFDRPRKERHLDLGGVTTSIGWSDAGPALTATMSVMEPEYERLGLKEGHVVQVDYAREGKGEFKDLFQMRVKGSSTSKSSGSVALTLVDELVWLDGVEDDFSYKKGKNRSKTKRPKGWLAHQIAADVARRYGLKTGKLAKGQHLIKNLTETNVSPLEVIKKAYELDRDETGRMFVIRVHRGKLEVMELRRSKSLLLLGEHLVEATIERALKEKFATILDVTATRKAKGGGEKDSKGDEGRKIKVTVRSSKKVRARLGDVRKPWDLSDPVGTEARAIHRAKRKLADIQKPELTVSVSVPGNPQIKRGDAVRLGLDDSGVHQFLYVKSAQHTVEGQSYTTDLELSFSDIFEDKEGDKIREKRCREARKHDRRPPGFCEEGFDPAAPARNRSRGDRHDDRDKAAR